MAMKVEVEAEDANAPLGYDIDLFGGYRVHQSVRPGSGVAVNERICCYSSQEFEKAIAKLLQGITMKLSSHPIQMLSIVVGVIACCTHLTQAQPAQPARPNIIIIMADDMGYSDIGCYGSEIETPTLDSLAQDGIRFTQFYNTSRCCPTRASLLTGLYPHQAGVGHMMQDRKLPGYRGRIGPNTQTIAEVLRAGGYSTYMSGKWHVTPEKGPKLEPGDQYNWPVNRGFDRFFGTIHGAGSFWDPNSLARGLQLIAPHDDFYYTEAIADNAVQFITEHNSERPFFMYVAFTCPHWPMHAREQDIAKYKGRYSGGWDKLRLERIARMQDMGLIKPEWKLTDRDPNAPAWEQADMKPWHERRMEVYAAMVDSMDQNIARIVGKLKEMDYFDNTLILFCADNGGCAEENGSRRAATPEDLQPHPVTKPMRPGEHQTQMVPTHSREGRKMRQGRGVMPGPADTYVAYGLPWANASNTPFRRYKHWVHEGGISSPLIVHWPAGIDARMRNQFYHDPAHLIDFMATCVDVGDAPYPRVAKGLAITPMQGTSLRPAFSGKPLERGKPIFFEHEGNRALRDGKWKLVARGHNGPWELYDMQEDRTETKDLSSVHPERTSAMAQEYEAWALSSLVKPWPWGARRGQK